MKKPHFSTLYFLKKYNIFPSFSPFYKKWEFYLGSENVFNYQQGNPIVDATNPFSDKFDATR